MMKIFRNLSRVLKISSAIAQGQKVSEYQIAWAYADLMLPELIEALKSGVSRSDAITALAVATQVKRSVACDVLCKKLKKAGYVADDDLEETDEQDDGEQGATPATPAAKRTKPPKQHNPVGHVIPITENPKSKPVIKPSPVPVPPADVFSAPKEYIEKPAESLTEPKPFRVGIRTGSAKFMGVDDIETEQKKEERRNAQKALEAIEAKHGTAKEQADRVREQ